MRQVNFKYRKDKVNIMAKGRTWKSTNLDSVEANALKYLLKEYNIKFEPSQIDDTMVHIEVFANSEEAILVGTFIDVIDSVIDYLHNSMNDNYQLELVTRLSSHADDYYLYIVMAKHKVTNEYAVWTSWNTTTKSLNFGHYNLTREQADAVVKEFKH